MPREGGGPRLQAPAIGPRRRAPRRLTAGSVVPVVLALLAAGFGYGALQDRAAMTSIVITSSLVPAGAAVDSRDTRAVKVHSSDVSVTQGLLMPSQLNEGLIAAVAVQAGQPITLSEVERPSAVPALGEMSISVPLAQAAGGRVSAGDLVDVIASDSSGGAYYVAQGLRVLAVAPTSSAGAVLGGATGNYFVVVGVGKQTALRIAAALGAQGSVGAGNGIEVVRSTGEPETAKRSYSAARSSTVPPTGGQASADAGAPGNEGT